MNFGEYGSEEVTKGDRFIAHIDPGAEYTISSDSMRVAFVAKMGKKQSVVVDGQEHAQYDFIGGGSLVFSPDSRRLAYTANVDKKQFVVVEGQEQPRYDDVGGLVFSPDGYRLACAWPLLAYEGQEQPGTTM